AADLAVGEVFDEVDQGIAREALARIGEDEDLARRCRYTGIERGGFAARGQFDEPDGVAERAHDARRVVGRAIRYDDDLAGTGIRDLDQVPQAIADPSTFVAGREDDRDRGPACPVRR